MTPRTSTTHILIAQTKVPTLTRTLLSVVCQIRTNPQLIILSQQSPHRVRSSPLLWRTHEIINHPFGLHRYDEITRVSGPPLLMCWCESDGEERFAVEAESAMFIRGTFWDGFRPLLLIYRPQPSQELPSLLLYSSTMSRFPPKTRR